MPYFAWVKTFSSETEEPQVQEFNGYKIKQEARDGLPWTDEGPGYELSTFKDTFGAGSTAFPWFLGRGGLESKGACLDHTLHVLFDKTESR